MNQTQIRQVIRDVLQDVDLWSEDAEELVFLTGLVESKYEYLKQIQGPARSFFQIEPNTAKDIYSNFLVYRPTLMANITKACQVDTVNLTGGEMGKLLTHNIALAIIFCRLQYRRVSAPIPHSVGKMALYWKKYYNTELGAGTVEKFTDSELARKDRKHV